MNVTLETVPVFIKAGSIIPMKEENQDLLLVTPEKGKKTTFTLYKDDGKTEAYKKGAYSEIIFTLDGNKLSAETAGTGEYLVKEFRILQPGQMQLSKARKVTLSELKAGIEL